ncbi:Uncharacterized protein Rs2_16207 [Raphanus sativus]|nr:Uncharacterized protein Rs2_16207 [Raphanus sativus]
MTPSNDRFTHDNAFGQKCSLQKAIPATPISTVLSAAASHRRLIRRRQLALLSTPSVEGDGEEETQDTLAVKISCFVGVSCFHQICRSRPAAVLPSPPSISDAGELPTHVDKKVSNARSGLAANMDAQPSLVTADLGSLPELSPPLKSVIVAQPTDPASTVEEVSKPLPELSSVAPPLSSSDSELLTKEIDEAPLLESPSLELVIVEPPTDPSSLEIEALKPQLELSVAAMPVSSSEGFQRSLMSSTSLLPVVVLSLYSLVVGQISTEAHNQSKV